ncbi:hypothetical protein IWQ61_002132 [Dispira simplex]|nr:hypothetical protein IWQ61_002132 [Dispira simplex]
MKSFQVTRQGILIHNALTPSQGSYVARGVRVLSTSRVVTQTVPSDNIQSQEEIAKRARNMRPVSPHLTIYQPQLTWYMSSVHRITGAALAAGLYGGAIAYVISPYVFGVTMDSTTIVSAFGALPAATKFSAKLLLSLPFTFHVFNGMRHLLWDTTRALSIKGVYSTGYTVLVASLVTSGFLASL